MTEAFFQNKLLFGEASLNALHIHAGRWLDVLMVFITAMGSEMFYLLILPVMYWCINSRIALKAGIIFLVSVSVNDVLKNVFMNPRPDPALLDERFRDLAERHMPRRSPGFPSGHTMSSTCLWGPLAWYIRHRRIVIPAVFFIIAVPYSRIYLGVHHLGDVVGGYVLSILILAVMVPAIAVAEKHGGRIPLAVRIAAALIVPGALILLLPGTHIHKNFAVLSGFLCGAMIAEGRLDFHPSNTFSATLAKTLLGLWVVVLLRNGLKAVLPAHLAFEYARYLLIGLWCTLAAPYIFSKIPTLKGNPPGDR